MTAATGFSNDGCPCFHAAASVNGLRWTEQLLHGNLQSSMLQLFTQSQNAGKDAKHIILSSKSESVSELNESL